MRKVLICALALSGVAASAQAADLSVDSLKDALPDTVSYAGVTLYGTIDVGYGYNSAGLPESGYLYTGLDYGLQKLSGVGQVSTLTNNALEASKVGLKIEEGVGMGFTAIGKLETDFNPASGELDDACQSVLQASGLTGAAAKFPNLVSYADGSRCGQAFTYAYAGLSNPMYGTLTIGRQNSLINDGVGTYDPFAGSFAFSLIGFSGGAAGGIGSTETARWDNSLKYLYQYGPVHASVMYASGAQDTAIFGYGVGANVGATYKGFSLDAYYTRENDAAGVGIEASSAGLAGTVTDNEAWAIMGKYIYDFGGGFKDGCGLKDADCAGAKLTFYGGYVYMDLSNPDNIQSFYNGFNTEGGYPLLTTQKFNLYATDKILETAWGGASFETGPWTLTGAFYNEHQDAYTAITSAGLNQTCAQATPATSGVSTKAKDTTPGQCAGDIDWGSVVVDYRFSKHFDVYAGVTVEDISGGIGAGFIATENVSVASGLRLKF